MIEDPPRNTVDAAARRILGLVLKDYRGPVAIRLWNGETVGSDLAAPCTLVFRHPAVLRDLVLHQDLMHLAEILDVEGLRRHYALTLRRWVQALQAHRTHAVKTVSEATYRLWRLYMAGSAYYFDRGSVNVYQVLAGQAYQPLATPLRRDDLYRNTGEVHAVRHQPG